MNSSPTLSPRERILGGLWGSLVGDALGVPVEFKDRATVQADPVFSRFRRVLQDDLARLPEGEVVSSGYVLHTLHASLWCLLSTTRFEACVLNAVNLGGDTDTTGCVAGGLAGVHYGLSGVPEKWRRALARSDELETLFVRFAG